MAAIAWGLCRRRGRKRDGRDVNRKNASPGWKLWGWGEGGGGGGGTPGHGYLRPRSPDASDPCTGTWPQ